MSPRPPAPPTEPTAEPTEEERAQSALTVHVFRAKARWYEKLKTCPGCDSSALERSTSHFRSYSMAGGGGRGLHDVTHTCKNCGWHVYRRNVVKYHSNPSTPDRLLKLVAECSERWQVLPLVPAGEVGARGGTVWISEQGQQQQVLDEGCSPAGRAACALAATLLRVAHQVQLDEFSGEQRATMRIEAVRSAVDGAVVVSAEEATLSSDAETDP